MPAGDRCSRLPSRMNRATPSCFLELLDLGGHVGLDAVEFLGGAGDPARLDHGAEHHEDRTAPSFSFRDEIDHDYSFYVNEREPVKRVPKEANGRKERRHETQGQRDSTCCCATTGILTPEQHAEVNRPRDRARPRLSRGGDQGLFRSAVRLVQAARRRGAAAGARRSACSRTWASTAARSSRRCAGRGAVERRKAAYAQRISPDSFRRTRSSLSVRSIRNRQDTWRTHSVPDPGRSSR